MIMSHISSSNSKSILFFGRENCDASEEIFKRLLDYDFDVTYIKSKVRGEKLPENIFCWEGDYILCFRSLFILPKLLLDKAKVAAINFHPAPPEYPGSGCINFALYENVEEYGVTAHIMNEKIDNGQILEVRRFSISTFDNLKSVLLRTHNELFKLILDFIGEIFSENQCFIDQKKIQSKNESWNGNARSLKELDDLQSISLNVTKEELKNIIRSTYIEGYPPKVEIHGYIFYLNLDKS